MYFRVLNRGAVLPGAVRNIYTGRYLFWDKEESADK